MMKRIIALAAAAVASSSAQAENLFSYSWAKVTKQEVFQPPAGGPTFYLPNGLDKNIQTRPADTLYKTGLLSVRSNPTFTADLFGVTSKLFAFGKSSSHLIVWDGAFPLVPKQNILITMSYGTVATLGTVRVKDGKLAVYVGGGKYQPFATYKGGKRHGFIWALNTAKDGKVSYRVTFTNEGEGLQSSPWVPLEVTAKGLAQPNYMTLMWGFPHAQKPGDTSAFYLQGVGMDSHFTKP